MNAYTMQINYEMTKNEQLMNTTKRQSTNKKTNKRWE